MKRPFFTISLDFELFWGMRDVATIESYGKNILGGRNSIPKILEIFHERNIHATWGVVGFILFENKKELLENLPESLPSYENTKLNPYPDLEKIGKNEQDDPYHFGYSLVKKILDTKGMEIASHSFSHFYCKEKNTNTDSFDSDLKASLTALKRFGISPKSYIFCRNQYEDSHLDILRQNGFKAFRGIEKNKIFDPKANRFFRFMRLMDSYLNFSGSNFSNPILSQGLINIPSSRFLRPANKNIFESLRIKRITNAMTDAAKSNSGFHLWWHPHNFGKNQKDCFSSLLKILDHFETLKEKYGMQSLNMFEISQMKNSNE